MLFSFNKEAGESNAAVNTYSGQLGVLAEGFKEAAELVIQEAINDSGKTDPLVFPIIYLYRHHLELRLKELMDKGNRIIQSPDGFDDGHNLGNLWTKVKPLASQIDVAWLNEHEHEVDSIIKQFDDVDRQSMSFRYTVDTRKQKRKDLVENVSYIGLSKFKTEIDPIIFALEDLAYGFDERLENWEA